MVRRVLVVVCVLVAAVTTEVPPVEGKPPSPPGTVERLVSFDPAEDEHPEGLAIDKRGRAYVTFPFRGELRRIDPDGSQTKVADLASGQLGPIGLAVDAPGNVYVAVVSFGEDHGVHRVAPSGTTSLVPGSEAIAFPNGLAFDDRGNLYVTDSIAGAIWRIPRHGTAEVWLQDPLLEGDGSTGLGFPLGANGIAYDGRTVWVTNMEMGRIVSVPVRPDGSPGSPTLVVESGALTGADGLALDVHDGLYVAVIAQSKVVRVSPDGGSIVTLADAGDGLDFPSSLAFGTGRGTRSTLFVVSFAIGHLFGAPPAAGPSLSAIEVGVPGRPLP